MKLKTDKLYKYVRASEYINYDHPFIEKKAKELKTGCFREIELIEKTYKYVRDEIRHSFDAKDKIVSISASDTIKNQTGMCYAKANLLAALLRYHHIPTGICYQKLTLGDTPESGYCIHALNGVYIASLNKWIRLDARGNKEGVNSQFSIKEEKLAFSIRKEYGEIDYPFVYPEPLPRIIKVLEDSTDLLNTYKNQLPTELNKEEQSVE